MTPPESQPSRYPIPPTEGNDAKDAARYRWLRKHHEVVWESSMDKDLGARSVSIDFDAPGESLDSAIDAAMGAQK